MSHPRAAEGEGKLSALGIGNKPQRTLTNVFGVHGYWIHALRADNFPWIGVTMEHGLQGTSGDGNGEKNECCEGSV